MYQDSNNKSESLDVEEHIIYDDDEVQSIKNGHLFEDPQVAERYAAKYKAAKFDGRHLFDPKMQWDKSEERRALWKTDLNVTLFAFALFFALHVDRYNLTNAVSGTFIANVKMTKNDYNLGNTLNTVCSLTMEIPSLMIARKIGPHRLVPIKVVCWSLVTALQCKITNKAGFLTTRAIMGLFEGGFIPCMCLWLSYFYTERELGTRLGYFYLANPITSILSAVIAWAIYHLKDTEGWKSWQYIFLIEGIVTMVIGLIAWFQMPASISQTKAKWRPNGWYTQREEGIMVNRLLRDDPEKGNLGKRSSLTLKQVYDGALDWRMWPVYWSRMLIEIAAHPVQMYLPFFMKTMKFSTRHINLLMIPHNIGMIVTMQTQTYASRAIQQIGYLLVFTPLWLFPCATALKFWPGFLHNHWGTYTILTVFLSFPPPWPLTIGWVSSNAHSVKKRSVTLPLVNMFGQLGLIIGNNVFRMNDAPYYEQGLCWIMGVSLAAVLMVLGTRVLYKLLNQRKRRIWSSMTQEEQEDYVENTMDEDTSRLDVYWKL